MTTTRRSGRMRLDARDQVQPVLVRHHHVGDHQVALAVLHPAPQRRGVAGAAHLVAGAAQRLRQHGADRAVVVGDQHGGGVMDQSVASCGRRAVASASLVGQHRQMQAEFGAARAGCPPRSGRHGRRRSWRPAQGRGRCRPACEVTNGSNRCGRMSSGMPGPLSRTATTSGRSSRVGRAGHGQPHAVLEGGGQHDLAGSADAGLGDRLGGVLHQVQHHLHQLVAVAPDRRQRRDRRPPGSGYARRSRSAPACGHAPARGGC